jgi:hypothetical protein
MTVRRLMVPSGEIELEANTSETQLAADTQLFQLLEIAVLCNEPSWKVRKREVSAIRWSWQFCASGSAPV